MSMRREILELLEVSDPDLWMDTGLTVDMKRPDNPTWAFARCVWSLAKKVDELEEKLAEKEQESNA